MTAQPHLVLDAHFDRERWVNVYTALVEISSDCKVEFSGYVEHGPVQRIRVEKISTVAAAGLIQFAAWLIAREEWLIWRIGEIAEA